MSKEYYLWLKNTIESNYRFVRNIKRSEDTVINVMENISNQKRVVVKYIVGKYMAYEKLVQIEHPNLPIVYDVASNEKETIIIEEYIDGITVGEVLETGLYNLKGVKRLVSELCQALTVLHSNEIIHRDIKPENIIVSRQGAVKLIDFDISRIGNDNAEKDTVILGTTGFAAPEQYGIAQTDERSDIYSIGILINVMLTGDHPSKKMCKGKWQKIVNKCTRINPDERYQSVKELMKLI